MNGKIELLNSLFISRDYDGLLTELKKIRLFFLDEKYPNIVHDIVWQIDDINRFYRKSDYQALDLIIKNFLGMESGKYRFTVKRNVMSLKDALGLKNGLTVTKIPLSAKL